MYIPIELKVGSIAFGICPAEKDPGGWPMQNLILGIVTNIDWNFPMGERAITIRADNPKVLEKELPEWRVSEFDFGGVPVPNPWFDQDRIEAEDHAILGNNKP